MLDVDRSLDPKRFADCKDTGAEEFAGFDLRADVVGIGELRGYVEDGGETPAGKYGLELRVQDVNRLMVGVEEFWRHEVDMAVPEARGNGEPGAVDRMRVRGNLDGVGRADGCDARVMDEDRRVVERWTVRLRVNRGVREGEIGGAEGTGKDEKSDRSEDEETHEWLYAGGKEIDPTTRTRVPGARLVSGQKH